MEHIDYYDFLEQNFHNNMAMLDSAIKYCEKNFLHDDIINELYNDNDLKKQLCLIELNEIKSQQEANILVYNLTNHSGPIRETSAYKILELIKDDRFCSFFQTKNILDTFIQAITDINPSVSRNSVEIIQYVNNSQYLYNKLIERINVVVSELKNIRQARSYIANKKNFSLYWTLEGLTKLKNKTIDDKLVSILEQTSLSNDYTIREKTAKVAVTYKIKSIIECLKSDENIYVRNIALSFNLLD